MKEIAESQTLTFRNIFLDEFQTNGFMKVNFKGTL